MTMCSCPLNSCATGSLNVLPTFVNVRYTDKKTKKEDCELVNANQITRIKPDVYGGTIYYNTCDDDGNIIGRCGTITEKNYNKLNIRA